MKTQAKDMTARTLEAQQEADKGKREKSERETSNYVLQCTQRTNALRRGEELGKPKAKMWLGLERPKYGLRRHLNTLLPSGSVVEDQISFPF